MTRDRLPATEDNRERILAAATRLLIEEGRETLSTRAVSAAAGVQAPTIYRIFGDKRGLLDAVAVHGFEQHLADKRRMEPTDDPVEDLRTGWNLNVEFGLTSPALYRLMYAESQPDGQPPAAAAALEILAGYIDRIAAAGRLRINSTRATQLVHAAGSGTTLALIAMPEGRRDRGVSELAREAVIAAITTDAPVAAGPGAAAAAIALRAALPRTTALTAGELGLLEELLDRIGAADEDI